MEGLHHDAHVLLSSEFNWVDLLEKQTRLLKLVPLS